MFAEGVVVKMEDYSAPEWTTLTVVKKEDPGCEAAVKFESELILNNDCDEAYSAGVSLAGGQCKLEENTAPLTSSENCLVIDPEGITIKSEPGLMEEGSSNSSVDPLQCEPTEVDTMYANQGTSQEYVAGAANIEGSVSGSVAAENSDVPSTSQSSVGTLIGPIVFVCKHCPAVFQSENDVKQHLEIHLKPFPCTQCSARYKSRSALRQHRAKHSGEKQFACEICSARFHNKFHLQRHSLKHSEERPFPCELCPACFKTKWELAKHLLAHSDERPFPCEVCSARFKSRANLQAHFRRHTDEEPFPCELCSMRFKTKANLKTHLRLHANPFRCWQCPAFFLGKQELFKHMQVHYGQVSFPCEV